MAAKPFVGKLFRNCLLFVLLIVTVSFVALQSERELSSQEAITVQASIDDTYFPARHFIFEKFVYSGGLFILRDNYAVYDRNDVFYGDIVINEDSKMFRMVDGVKTNFVVFDFKPVVFERGQWEETALFTIEPFENSVVWYLPKRTPGGLYGVRVRALEQKTDDEGNRLFHPLLDDKGRPVLDAQGNPRNGDPIMVEALDYAPSGLMSAVEGVFAILYGDELNYINVTDQEGHVIYDAQTRPKTVGTQIIIDVNINGGAMIRTGLTEGTWNSATMGNLTLAAGVLLNPDLVEVSVEDLYGNKVSSDLIRADVYSSHIVLTLAGKLPKAKYYLKVVDPRTTDIYGTYIIDNVGNDTFGGIIGGTFFVIFGLLLLAGAAFMFLGPVAAVYLHKRKYKSIEKNREDEIDKSWKAQSAKDSFKNAMNRTGETLEELNGLDAERAKSKGAGFLSKMAESRMKREIARNAGLTMEEFKELEEKQRQSDTARKTSLKDFRKMVEETTKPQNEEDFVYGTYESSADDKGITEEDKTEDNKNAVAEEITDYEPREDKPESIEFNMLDSIGKATEEMDEDLREAIFGKHKPSEGESE